MDNKAFLSAISKATGRDVAQVSLTIQKLAEILSSYCSEMDAVAIPGFGTFQPVKHSESVEHDSATGRSTLVPPSIQVEFKPSVLLRKSLS